MELKTIDHIFSGLLAGITFLLLFIVFDIKMVSVSLSSGLIYLLSVIGLSYFDKNNRIKRENQRKLNEVRKALDIKIARMGRMVTDKTQDNLFKLILDAYKVINNQPDAYNRLLHFDMQIDTAIKVMLKYENVKKYKKQLDNSVISEKISLLVKQLERIFSQMVEEIQMDEIQNIDFELSAIEELLEMDPGILKNKENL